jgi:peptidoglycan/LPS O-acetylase OafA/YrhL
MYVLHWHGQHFIEHFIPYKYYWWLVLDGVDLFFVLSGFLVGGILLRTINDHGLGGKQVLYFWIRRWLRTLPAYFLVLTLLLILYQLFRGGLPERFYEYYFFVQCFNSPHPVFFSEAWSLAVEEWFYLLLPLGLFLIPLKGDIKKRFLIWICLVLVAVTLHRVFKVYTHEYMDGGNYSAHVRRQVLTRLDSIMYGVFGAYIHYYFTAAWNSKRNVLFFSGLFIIFGARIGSAYDMFFLQYFYFSVQAIGILLLLPKLNSVKTGNGYTYKLLTLISIISYSMYLLNHRAVVIVEAICRKAGLDFSNNEGAGIAAYILSWIVTCGMAYVLYRFFELPMMSLRAKFKLKPTQKSTIPPTETDI